MRVPSISKTANFFWLVILTLYRTIHRWATSNDQVINKLATGNEQRLFVELRVGADEAEDDESVANFLVKGTHVAGDIYTVETGVFTGKRVQAQGWVMWVIEPKPLAFFELAA